MFEKSIAMLATALSGCVMLFLLTGCGMTELEYNLRKADIQNKASHPVLATVVIRGPLELKDGAVLEIPFQLFPYTDTKIPDGQAIWANVVSNGVIVGATAATVMYGAHEMRKAKGKTINNYSTPAEGTR